MRQTRIRQSAVIVPFSAGFMVDAMNNLRQSIGVRRRLAMSLWIPPGCEPHIFLEIRKPLNRLGKQ